jgi:hypothetical protein
MKDSQLDENQIINRPPPNDLESSHATPSFYKQYQLSKGAMLQNYEINILEVECSQSNYGPF